MTVNIVLIGDGAAWDIFRKKCSQYINTEGVHIKLIKTDSFNVKKIRKQLKALMSDIDNDDTFFIFFILNLERRLEVFHLECGVLAKSYTGGWYNNDRHVYNFLSLVSDFAMHARVMWAWVSHPPIDLQTHASFLVERYNQATNREAQMTAQEKLMKYVSSQQWRFHGKEEEATIIDNVNRKKQILYAPLGEILPENLMTQLIDWEKSITRMDFPEGILEDNGIEMQEMFVWENMRILFKKARDYGQQSDLFRAPNLDITSAQNIVPPNTLPPQTETSRIPHTRQMLLREWKLCVIIMLSAWFCFSLGCIFGGSRV